MASAGNRQISPVQAEKVREFLRWAVTSWVAPSGAKPSQLAVQEATGVSQSMLSQIISGVRSPGVSPLTRIAGDFGVTVDQLLSGEALRLVRGGEVREGVERYPNRAFAIEYLVRSGYDPEECRASAPESLDFPLIHRSPAQLSY